MKAKAQKKTRLEVTLQGRPMTLMLNPDPTPETIVDLNQDCVWCPLKLWAYLEAVADCIESPENYPSI